MFSSIREKVQNFLIGREIAQLQSQRSELDTWAESLSRLQVEIENEGYQRLGHFDDDDLAWTAVKDIIKLARAMYVKNPNITRAVDIQADYVFAQGVTVGLTSGDESEPINQFWNRRENRTVLTSQPSLLFLEQELQITGNLFFVFYADGRGKIARRLECSEIADIYCNPEDRFEPWFYKRVWTDAANVQHTEWHPSIYLDDQTQAPKGDDADKPVVWGAPVYHMLGKRTGRMKFGIPEIYPSLAWALAYKRFLENWATIMAAYARLAMKISGMKNRKQAAAALGRLNTSVGQVGDLEGNPSSIAGSTFIAKEGINVEAVKTSGATTPASEGEPLLDMVASGHGIPNTFFGNASKGNYATAKTLDRPTELKFLSRQQKWSEVLKDVVAFCVGLEPSDIEVTFPEILERNVTDRVRAVINAASGFGKPLNPDIIPDRMLVAEMILDALKVPNKKKRLAEFLKAWGGDWKVPPIPVPTVAPAPGAKGKGASEGPGDGGNVGANG